MNERYTNNYGDAGRPASVLNVLAGIWLIISAWVLGFSMLPTATWDAVLVGIAVLVLAAIRLGTTGTVGLSWVNFILGIWMLISPWALRFTDAGTATGNAVILGILVGIFGLWGALAPRTTGTTVAPPR